MKISVGTVARTVILMLALINQILTVFGRGIINVSDEDINTLISTVFTVVSALTAWWKNNSFTSAAITADEIMKSEKSVKAEKGGKK